MVCLPAPPSLAGRSAWGCTEGTAPKDRLAPWGVRVFKVNKRIFVFLHGSTTELRATTKLPRWFGAALLAPFCRPTGYNLGKSGWVTSAFGKGGSPPFDILRSWIEESYRAVAPKRLAKHLMG